MTPVEKDPSKGVNAKLAATIRAERGARRMTIDVLAEKSDIPKRTLIRLLNAERAIDIEHAAAIANAFGLTLATLLAMAAARPDVEVIPSTPKPSNVTQLPSRRRVPEPDFTAMAAHTTRRDPREDYEQADYE